MPHAILHAMGVFAASNTYMRIRERDNNYIFMNPGRVLQQQVGDHGGKDLRRVRGALPHGEKNTAPQHKATSALQKSPKHPTLPTLLRTTSCPPSRHGTAPNVLRAAAAVPLPDGWPSEQRRSRGSLLGSEVRGRSLRSAEARTALVLIPVVHTSNQETNKNQ